VVEEALQTPDRAGFPIGRAPMGKGVIGRGRFPRLMSGLVGAALACSVALAPVATTATALAAPAQQAAADTVVVGAPAWVDGTEGRGLRVRSAPGLTGERIGSLAEGARVQVLEGPVAADELPWYRISATGLASSGWVDGKALTAAAPPPPNGQATVAVDRPAWVAGTGGLDLRVRSAPALGSDVLGELIAGAGVQVLEGPHAAEGYEWYRVSAGPNLSGWVAGRFLSAIPPASSAPAPNRGGA
jgi:hypothetical protein